MSVIEAYGIRVLAQGGGEELVGCEVGKSGEALLLHFDLITREQAVWTG